MQPKVKCNTVTQYTTKYELLTGQIVIAPQSCDINHRDFTIEFSFAGWLMSSGVPYDKRLDTTRIP